MAYFRPPGWVKKIFPEFIWSFPEETDSVFLTFDDGPIPVITPWVLDQLDKYDAKATFFCLGKNVEMHPDVFQLIRERGHSVGNHSYSHIKGWGTDSLDYVHDIDLAESLITTNLFRPPYGRIKPSQVHVLKERYKFILWDVLSRDYSWTLSGKGCAKNVLNVVRPGSIIVFHDSKKAEKNLRYALPIVLEGLKKKGYKMKAIRL
jgi:peptidoglycan/xylan/chitin deacetylase (PgdA/CDA1 family)